MPQPGTPCYISASAGSAPSSPADAGIAPTALAAVCVRLFSSGVYGTPRLRP